MKRIIFIICFSLLFSIHSTHAQKNERDILLSIDELRDSIVKADIRLNHELFKIVLEQVEITKRAPSMFLDLRPRVSGTDTDAELDEMILEINRLNKTIDQISDSILLKNRDLPMPIYGAMDSLNTNPKFRELKDKRMELMREANLLSTKRYVEDRMKSGRYIDIPLTMSEKERYMENPILKKINAQIELYEKMIKAKEEKLIAQ